MTDLSPSELDEYGDSTGACDHLVTVRMVAEIRRWRAAAVADEERVRSVVRGVVMEVAIDWSPRLSSVTLPMLADAIASRAEKQLASAAVRLSAEDISIIDAALGCWSSDDNDAPHEAISELRDRLRP